MSTTIANDIASLDAELNDMILRGQALEAFERFYADNVTLKGVGRVKMEQVAVRTWRDGLVAAERFYYNVAG